MQWLHHFKKGLAIWLLTGSLVVGVGGAGFAAGQGKQTRTKPVRVKLFGTIEFRSDLKALPQWMRVLGRVEQQMTYFITCKGNGCSPAAKSWQRGIRLSQNKSPMETLKSVNAFFNQWPYRLDIEIYGRSDYWATPEEFLKLSGDCEDFSIAKYFALKQLGFKSQNMRIVVIKDRIRNIGHAVLAVYMDDTAFILDNLSNLVLPHSRYRHYVPQYSVNGTNRWAHIRPIGKQGF
jgi:predicted transglutaminase-like cysteine proteinase